MGVDNLHNYDKYEIRDNIIKQAKKCVNQDKSESIILATTCMNPDEYKIISQELNGIPVIDSVYASFKHCEYLLDLKHKFNWGHSLNSLSMQSPPNHEIEEWKLFEDVNDNIYRNIIHSFHI